MLFLNLTLIFNLVSFVTVGNFAKIQTTYFEGSIVKTWHLRPSKFVFSIYYCFCRGHLKMCTLINFCLRFLQGSANIPLFGDLASQWACLIMKLLNTVIIFLIMTHTASSSAPARRFVKKIQSPDYIKHMPQVVAVLLLVQLVNPFTL